MCGRVCAGSWYRLFTLNLKSTFTKDAYGNCCQVLHDSLELNSVMHCFNCGELWTARFVIQQDSKLYQRRKLLEFGFKPNLEIKVLKPNWIPTFLKEFYLFARVNPCIQLKPIVTRLGLRPRFPALFRRDY